MAKGQASTKEIKNRVEQIKDLLLNGKTRADILKKYTGRGGVSERHVDNYIAKAKQQIRESAQTTFSDSRALMIRNLWDCYHNARAQNQWASVASFTQQLSKLYGLDIVKIEHQITRYEDMTDDELSMGLNDFENEAPIH